MMTNEKVPRPAVGASLAIYPPSSNPSGAAPAQGEQLKNAPDRYNRNGRERI